MKGTKINLAKTSYNMTVASAIMISLGILLGSFIKYTVHLATFGAFLLLIALITYIISELK